MHLSSSPSWLLKRQAEAAELAKSVGFPTKNDESWRYTSLAEFAKISFQIVENKMSSYEVSPRIRDLVSEADHILAFYNGVYLEHDSSPSGQSILPLSQVIESENENLFRSLLDRQPNANLKNLGLDNLAQFNEGSFVKIESSLKKTIVLLHFYGETEGVVASEISKLAPHVVYPRIVCNFGAKSQTELIELHFVNSDIAIRISSSCDFILEEEARVEAAQVLMLKNKTFGFADSYCQLARGAELKLFNLNSGGRLSRSELQVRIQGEDVRVSLNNLNIASQDSHIDVSSSVFHEKGHSQSEQLVKSVVGEDAQAIFSGKLKIAQDAQKSNARQYCHNLLLTDSSEADARPQLEVLADDVKAAHGATIGQLDEEEMFYLQSRGISKETAEKILAVGFKQEVVSKIESPFIKKFVADFFREVESE